MQDMDFQDVLNVILDIILLQIYQNVLNAMQEHTRIQGHLHALYVKLVPIPMKKLLQFFASMNFRTLMDGRHLSIGNSSKAISSMSQDRMRT